MDYLQYHNLKHFQNLTFQSFKPCYKWITFNIFDGRRFRSKWSTGCVLNLVINGLPSIQIRLSLIHLKKTDVLNLVINGLPSIYQQEKRKQRKEWSFKPCYKWITFNISVKLCEQFEDVESFKPCYKWITFNILEKETAK